ncbi:MAG TPA: hypothetical protein ENI07_13040 [Desulfobacterales bacterium]|nr:hypothetical protein [Desulfobacterales bacterium]
MKFEIKSATNGCILKCTDDDSEYVYQFQGLSSDVEAFADFLRELTDAHGPQDGRYEELRIHILVKPGDKHPDFNGCPECGEHMEV